MTADWRLRERHQAGRDTSVPYVPQAPFVLIPAAYQTGPPVRSSVTPAPFEDEDDDKDGNEELALQNIQDREQEHPHDINEVPIKTCALEEPVLRGRDVTGQRSDQTYDQKDYTNGNVTTVKSGQHEKA
jgi:hypothetical protein